MRPRARRPGVFVAPALIVHRRVLLPAGARRAGAEPHRLRHLRARRLAQPALRRASRTTRACCATPLFWKALGNTLYFVVVGVPLSIGVSLGAALLAQFAGSRGSRGFFRTVFFAPVVTTLVAVAVVWRYLFHTRYGLLNYALGRSGIAPIDWLGDPHWAMPAIIMLAVWKNFGYNMIIFLAGAAEHPRGPVRGGAHRRRRGWQQFRHVTLPVLGPTLLLVSILTMTGYFQLFAEPYVMTQGGPLQSDRTACCISCTRKASTGGASARASAVAFLLFMLMFAVTAVQLRLASRAGRRMKRTPRTIAGEHAAGHRRAAGRVPAAVDALGVVHADRRGEHVSAAAAAARIRRSRTTASCSAQARSRSLHVQQRARRDAARRCSRWCSTRWRATPSPSCASRGRERDLPRRCSARW